MRTDFTPTLPDMPDAPAPDPSPRLFGRWPWTLAPGLGLCASITAASYALERVETWSLGGAFLEALVLAILAGIAVRSAWTPGPSFVPGIRLSAKTLLEVAVLLLGLAVDARAVVAAGVLLPLGIAATVVLALCGGYAIGRALALPHRMALLIACGNAICGNSAIAAVAPVIGATGKEVAASIAFTAVLGVVVVLSLPPLAAVLHAATVPFGVFVGLTVYAVPQVLAAAAPLGPAALRIATLVKLVRVLMLGPVVLCLSLRGRGRGGLRPKLHALVPWFIVGFLLLAALRAAGWVPDAVLPVASRVAGLLTVVSMAALGLGTDLRAVARAGPRASAAVVGSLLLLAGISAILIRALPIG